MIKTLTGPFITQFSTTPTKIRGLSFIPLWKPYLDHVESWSAYRFSAGLRPTWVFQEFASVLYSAQPSTIISSPFDTWIIPAQLSLDFAAYCLFWSHKKPMSSKSLSSLSCS